MKEPCWLLSQSLAIACISKMVLYYMIWVTSISSRKMKMKIFLSKCEFDIHIFKLRSLPICGALRHLSWMERKPSTQCLNPTCPSTSWTARAWATRLRRCDNVCSKVRSSCRKRSVMIDELNQFPGHLTIYRYNIDIMIATRWHQNAELIVLFPLVGGCFLQFCHAKFSCKSIWQMCHFNIFGYHH